MRSVSLRLCLPATAIQSHLFDKLSKPYLLSLVGVPLAKQVRSHQS
jgi:hypothetical protein